MELYNKKDNPPDTDLHDEGIDLVGSGVNEENEFTGQEMGTTEPEPPKTPEVPVPPAPIVTPPAVEPPKPPTVTPGVITPSISFTPTPKLPEPIAQTSNPQEPNPAPLSTPPSQNDPSIKPLRTFKTDAEEAVRYKNVSAVDIALAEQKKRESTPIEYTEEKQSHPGILITFVLIIILALGGGWFYWFKTSQGTETTPSIQASVQTIIPYTKGSTLLLNSESDPLTLIGAKLNASNAGLGNVYAIVPTLGATSTEAADIKTVFGQTHISPRLLRSLAPEYMIGTYTYDVNSPFIILKNTFFQNAFAGMLDWEQNMHNDLLPLINVPYPSENSTNVATSTFEDTVVSNIDTRELRNSDGKVVLAYAFANTETLVIATSENALKYVLDRLLTVRSVQ